MHSGTIKMKRISFIGLNIIPLCFHGVSYSVLEDRVTGDQYLCEDDFGVKLAQLTGRDLSAVTFVPGMSFLTVLQMV